MSTRPQYECVVYQKMSTHLPPNSATDLVPCAFIGLAPSQSAPPPAPVSRQPTVSAEALRLQNEQEEAQAIAKVFISHLQAEIDAGDEPMMCQRTFDEIVHKKIVLERLRDYGIDMSSLGSVFHLIDVERTDCVAPGRVARRLLGLRGVARSQDVTRLSREVERLKQEISMAVDNVADVHTLLRKSKARSQHAEGL